MGSAILYSEMIPEKEWEERFNRWYDTEHIPIRMQIPGFKCARRYREVNARKYLAVYEIDDIHVLHSDEYRSIKENSSEETRWMLSSVSGFTRYIGMKTSEQVDVGTGVSVYEAPFLYAVAFTVPIEREKEFNEWYTVDHVPTLLRHPDWWACRRYRIVEGEPDTFTHLALHYLAGLEALQSKERQEARSSPWRARLAKEGWFRGVYTVFEKINSFSGRYSVRDEINN
ncbi:DUF4286 family protein [Kyrpidia sp.]|uniref:DUF4286 family protein n=1 Tax=Kyrpidia sp. TaxID=2073077 RepID=UPI0025843431|nr:DUF4286 family protein [Kyrpidia sp.]MCL6577439.1 hypothetical protein [Kyrpidia sp.]